MSKIPSETSKRISTTFQKRINELIEDQDCSKYQFASSVGIGREVITRATIYGIIPSLQSLTKIADYLNISITYLLGENDTSYFYKSDNPTTFSNRLEELAAEKGVKYSQIAHKMPFAYSYFYDWLRTNTVPSLEYLEALADYFDVSIDYLLGRTDDKYN